MYWGSGDKKRLRDIKELVHSGDVSYTKWKKARQVHPQVARIEKAAKAKRMIKVSGKEGKARGSLVFTGADEELIHGNPNRVWAFIRQSDEWMGPDDGYMRFMVGSPTQDVLSTMGVQGKKFAPMWKKGKTSAARTIAYERLTSKRASRASTKKQVAIMEKDMAIKRQRGILLKSSYYGGRVRKRQGIVAGTGFAISGALLYGQHDSYKIKKSPKIKRGYTGKLIKTSRGFVQERKKGKR